VITLDIITMVVFVSYILVMKYLLRQQERDFDKKNVTVDDYALQIQNLPQAREEQ